MVRRAPTSKKPVDPTPPATPVDTLEETRRWHRTLFRAYVAIGVAALIARLAGVIQDKIAIITALSTAFGISRLKL